MQTVYKYTVDLAKGFSPKIKIPGGKGFPIAVRYQELNAIRVQNHPTSLKVDLWMHIDTNLPKEEREYLATLTAEEVPDDYDHVGTIFTPLGIAYHLWLKDYPPVDTQGDYSLA